jgi:phosphomannomutase
MLKHSLIVGLMTAGCEVNDIGLALSPVAYFAQFAYDCAAVAMVTASHNEKPWTGVKMGIEKPLTFGPAEMNALKDIALGGKWKARPGGSYVFHADARERYIADLLKDGPLKRRIRAVVACGNGTAAHYAPEVLAKLGEPYVTTRPGRTALTDEQLGPAQPRQQHVGMGLGFFIAKTLLERTGAELTFGNAFDGGASVTMAWPRDRLEIAAA